MSVVKMIIADDRHFVSSEPHGSDAQRIYAACAKNPKSIDDLNALLPEFDANADLREQYAWNDGLDLEPVDAGLIIVDLAKKWIFAEDTYFGAHRTGSYSPDFENDSKTIRYAFSDEWQFVSEAKWFNYLHSCDLKPYCEQNQDGVPEDMDEAVPFEAAKSNAIFEASFDDFEHDEFDENEDVREDWDDGMREINTKFTTRLMILIDTEAENAREERDYQTLEHVLKYEQWAEEAQYGVEKSREKIARLQIELQAVQNLWERTSEPRWALKRVYFRARIQQDEKRISRLTDEQSENAAMAKELRQLVKTEKYLAVFKKWEGADLDHSDDWDKDMPF